MSRLGFAFGSIFLLAVLAAPAAVACSCIPNSPPQEAYEAADLVFVGEVIDIEDEPGTYPAGWRVTLRVLHPVKGVFIETIMVNTANNSAACGFPFEQGRSYFVYADTEESKARVSLCSRTAALEDADADRNAFDVPDDLGSAVSRSRPCGGPTNAAALQVLFLVGLGALLLRRRG